MFDGICVFKIPSLIVGRNQPSGGIYRHSAHIAMESGNDDALPPL